MARYGVLGTGTVGKTLATKLVENGHEVTMGSRDPGKAEEWAGGAGQSAHAGSFADAAAFGAAVVNATAGTGSLDAVRLAGAESLAGKLLIDVANPLDFSRGMPPTLAVCNTDSLGEQLQRELPDTRVVKTLNTVNAEVMVDPGLVPGEHAVFVCGEDEGAKREVAELLASFGWPRERVLDLGGIESARATEMYLPLWLRLLGATGTPHVNVEVRAKR